MATSLAWATTSGWAIATACARPCSGRPTATAASPSRLPPRRAPPPDGRAYLPADPGALRLLLLHPAQRERIAVVAHAGARADAGLRHRCAAQPPRRGPRGGRAHPGARDAIALPVEAPLVRGEGPGPAIVTHGLSRPPGR